MIGSLSGTIAAHRGTHVVLDVSGVGYLVAVRSVFDFPLGEPALLHTHLAVRENALDLYGFRGEDELRMFEALIKLPKIGPKTAMQILMQAEVSTLTKAIGTNDPVYLTKMSGIGKKTAEKIVAELAPVYGTLDGGTTPEGGDSDVIDALLALGYAQKDARDAVAKLDPALTDTRKRITEALKYVSR